MIIKKKRRIQIFKKYINKYNLININIIRLVMIYSSKIYTII